MLPIRPEIFPIVGALQDVGIHVINAGPDDGGRLFVFFEFDEARKASQLLMARADEHYWYGYWQSGGGFNRRWEWTLEAGWLKEGMPLRVRWSFPATQLDAIAEVVAGLPIPDAFYDEELREDMRRAKERHSA